MQNDLINRSELLEDLEAAAGTAPDGQVQLAMLIRDKLLFATEVVKQEEAVDAEPVRHGRWQWFTNYGCSAHLQPIEPYDAGWGCSVCGIDLVQYLKSHFPDIPSYLECACEEMPTLERCSSCGAKMDGGAEDEKL